MRFNIVAWIKNCHYITWLLRTVIFLLNKHCRGLARLVVAGHLMVLEVEAPVHVVNRVRNLILVSHHSQIEGLKYTKFVYQIPLTGKGNSPLCRKLWVVWFPWLQGCFHRTCLCCSGSHRSGAIMFSPLKYSSNLLCSDLQGWGGSQRDTRRHFSPLQHSNLESFLLACHTNTPLKFSSATRNNAH